MNRKTPPETRSFSTPEAFREWLERNHATCRELILRLYKTHVRAKGIGYSEALDEALCFGWIDGVRRANDDETFVQRFSPRQPKSVWSAVNIRRAEALLAAGRMREPGRRAFEARPDTAAPYSFESRPVELPPAFVRALRRNPRAWADYQARPPWYRRTAAFWVMSAKREETRQRRFAHLLESAARGAAIGPLARPPRAAAGPAGYKRRAPSSGRQAKQLARRSKRPR